MMPTVSRGCHSHGVVRARRGHVRTQTVARPWHGGVLPNELSSFVGGHDRIATVATPLAAARLVTLTGVGGVGKTRLALRAARAARTEHAACSWITLSSAVDGS